MCLISFLVAIFLNNKKFCHSIYVESFLLTTFSIFLCERVRTTGTRGSDIFPATVFANPFSTSGSTLNPVPTKFLDFERKPSRISSSSLSVNFESSLEVKPEVAPAVRLDTNWAHIIHCSNCI
jgi:hypothetical protein